MSAIIKKVSSWDQFLTRGDSKPNSKKRPPALSNVSDWFSRLSGSTIVQSPTSSMSPASPVTPDSPTIQDVLLKPGKGSLSQVKRFLQRLGEGPIRVVIDDPVCPGLGHPAAVFTVMQRLEELGYSGGFHLVFSKGSRNKITHLLPGFKPDCKTAQVLGKITAQSLENLKEFEEVTLAIASPCKRFASLRGRYNSYAEMFRAQKFLALQPTGIDGPQFIGNKKGSHWDLVLAGAVLYAQPSALVDEKLALQALEQPQRTFFSELVSATQQRKITFVLAYGLKGWQVSQGHSSPKAYELLLRGLQRAQPRIGKPTVVLAFDGISNESAEIISEALRVEPEVPRGFVRSRIRDESLITKALPTPPVKIVQIPDGPGALHEVFKVPKSQIVLVGVGAQSKAIFNWLTTKATLSVVEGAGTRADMLALGLPHLHGGRPSGAWQATQSAISAHPLIRQQHALWLQVSSLLEQPQNIPSTRAGLDAFGRFMGLLLAGKLGSYFEVLRQEYLGSLDKVAAAVRMLSDADAATK
jgi:hypothetical protein